MTIAVTGANGEFGRAVVEALLARRPDVELVATVRDPAAADELDARGVDVRPGNFDDEAALAAAFAGVDTVLINATFFGADPSLRGDRVARAIDAATSAGASRILLTSWPDLDNCSLSSVQDYVRSESALRAAGPEWTILRLGYGLADAVGRDVKWAIRDGELVAPAGIATCTPAAVRDLAEAAAIQTLDESTSGTTFELSGPDAVSWPELAALAGEVAGRDIRYTAVTDDEWRARLTASGIPAGVTAALLDLYDVIRSGWANTPTTTLAEVLGRQPVAGVDAVRARIGR